VTTLATIPIVAREAEKLISAFTLTAIHARDIMVDRHGVLSFFYGPGLRRPRRVEIAQTAPDVYSVQIGHVDTVTHDLVIDHVEHDVPAARLRETVRELT
jgi:hypothetical protein